MAEDGKEKLAFPLGEIVAMRRFTLYEKTGGARQVIVEIGSPFPLAYKALSWQTPAKAITFAVLSPSPAWVWTAGFFLPRERIH
jgi:hypothetical protein